jgi:hypothetical protein
LLAIICPAFVVSGKLYASGRFKSCRLFDDASGQDEFFAGLLRCGTERPVAMDEEHLAAALRYVSLNPVRARLVERAQDWRWSSTSAHLRGRDDGLTALAPTKNRFPRFVDLLASEPEADLFGRLRAAESIGRPLGNDRFLSRVERLTGRDVKPGKRGPKPLKRQGR